MKRQRGRGRKSGNPANRSYESNGPEVKIRGNASQIYDKYLQLARDASSAGDRVRAENLYQHAEHYYRIVQANQPKRDPNQDDNDDVEANGEGEDGEITSEDNSQGDGQSNNRRSRDRNDRGRGRSRQPRNNDAEKDDPLGVVTPEGEAAADAPSAAPDGEASEEDAPRRRTRRPRRTKAEIEADKAAAAAALDNAGAAADGDSKDGSDSEAA
ncbi:DUF4167 domain-containing protein [Maricaulis parjimensis]|uniref:DUF4167 domain-containing protein n=1 Tax=Maricaulis parjimensis TaxID=144023 RepID=UPI0019397C12|nr:DUF4167 domain-containing protein [Maricaulis parjimensis]